MKVLLVDDEAASRTAIKMLADWKGNGVSRIFEAENGAEALEVVRRERPDVVFVDMNMPQMDGPAFLRELRHDQPNVAVVIASGYDRFDYAVQAIEAGAVAYLLKPIDPDQLNEALGKAVAFANAAPPRSGQEENAADGADIRGALDGVFLGKAAALTNAQERALGGLLPPGCHYVVCALRLGGVNRLLGKYAGNWMLPGASIITWAEKHCEAYGRAFLSLPPDCPHRGMLLLIGDNAASRPAIAEMLKGLSRGFQERFRVAAVAAVSAPRTGAQALSRAVAQANDLLARTNLFETPEKNVFFQAGPRSAPHFSALDMLPLYRSAASTQNESAFTNVLSVAFRPVRAASLFTFAQADQCIAQQTSMMADLLREGDGQDSPPARDAQEERCAFDYTTFEGFYQEMLRLLEAAIQALAVKQRWERVIDVERVKRYIDDNCYRDLRVQSIADGFFISREYLTKLFSKRYGMSIHSYIESMRMKKVLELLRQPDMRVQDVAQIMGFLDANYLSKKFKKFYGVSPSQYLAGESARG